MEWQGSKSANVECVQLAHVCSTLQMLNSDGARILNGANLHGVNQNRISPLPLWNPPAWCNSSINQEASAVRRRTSCASPRNIQQTLCTHGPSLTAWQALRFHPILRRCLKGFITVTAPLQQASPSPPFCSSTLSEVSFFPTACSFPFPAPLWCIAPSSTQSTQRGISPYHSIH